MPEFTQFTTGTRGYNTDWNNLAPNIGVAWRPDVETGWLRTLLGDPAAGDASRRLLGVVRTPGHWRLHRHLRTQPRQHAEPDAQRQHRPGRSRRKLAGAAAPDRTPLPGAVPRDRRPSRFRSGPNRADNINAFHPDIQVGSARSWTVGLQRAISSNMALEVRYVGTRGVNQWSTLNYNERNVDRERLSRRVQAGDGEPAGQQPRRRHARGLVRVLRRRAPAPIRCRSISRT